VSFGYSKDGKVFTRTKFERRVSFKNQRSGLFGGGDSDSDEVEFVKEMISTPVNTIAEKSEFVMQYISGEVNVDTITGKQLMDRAVKHWVGEVKDQSARRILEGRVSAKVSRVSPRVECEVCKKSVTKKNIRRHQKSSKCKAQRKSEDKVRKSEDKREEKEDKVRKSEESEVEVLRRRVKELEDRVLEIPRLEKQLLELSLMMNKQLLLGLTSGAQKYTVPIDIDIKSSAPALEPVVVLESSIYTEPTSDYKPDPKKKNKITKIPKELDTRTTAQRIGEESLRMKIESEKISDLEQMWGKGKNRYEYFQLELNKLRSQKKKMSLKPNFLGGIKLKKNKKNKKNT
jgi:hypothetical protein